MSDRIDKKGLINLVSERVGKDTDAVEEIVEATGHPRTRENCEEVSQRMPFAT